jgi:hypothetical protein
MEGELPVPEVLFLQCVDIVNDDQLRQIGGADSDAQNVVQRSDLRSGPLATVSSAAKNT